MSASEQEGDFDQLPEALRLALLDLVRRGRAEEDLAMSAAQIAAAAAIPVHVVNRRLSIALLKLRHRAEQLDL